ncbi:MAG: ABC transporter substrate-binding protein, partial [Elusimicrobia bacterium]|nr:ABC transporter substrate-binding protein [Elusimicrobiota bacterium]
HIFYGKKHLPESSVVFYPGALYRGWATVNMSPDFVRKNPDTVRKALRALLKAEEFVRAHREESIQLVARRLKLEPAVLDGLWAEHVFEVKLDRRLLRSFEEIGKWAMERAKKEGPPPDFRKYVHAGALARERPSAVRLSR